MALESFKRFFRRQAPDIKSIEASDNRWGVRVLDVRPVTLTKLLASGDQQCAVNAMSFAHEDGTCFIGEEPPVTRTVEAKIRFPVDRLLADGVLFAPREMEQLWALFVHRDEIICVDSWTRKVRVVARIQQHHDHVLVPAVRGVFCAEDEDPDHTVRLFEFLVRSHALDPDYPVPLPAGLERDPAKAANWCLSWFGNRALFATPDRIVSRDPGLPLRTISLLHIAVARGEISKIEAQLGAGIPIDLLAASGGAPLHWALEPATMRYLLERGSPVDIRSSDNETPLMAAVMRASLEGASFLLDHGADANACDRRGFTALHRAADGGFLELARLLLEHGASPSAEAEGHTPVTHAEARGNTELADAIRGYEGN